MTKQLIDMAHLEKYVSDDVTLRDEILAIFVEQIQALLSQFELQQDDESWKNTAHTLKGASRGVGAWKIGDLCEQAEKMIGDDSAKEEARETFLVSLRQLATATIEECQHLKEAVSA